MHRQVHAWGVLLRPVRWRSRIRSGESVRTATSAGPCPEDPPGTVRFETVQARHRHILIEPMGDAVEFVAHGSPPWTPGRHVARQIVTRGALPDTVSCGRGYLEVLAFLHDGIVVNEVRTFGDQMIAMPWSGTQPD
jgi:hypothetical protein